MFKNSKKTEVGIEKKAHILPKKYTKPSLKELGDLRAITLGGTTSGIDFSVGDNRGPFQP